MAFKRGLSSMARQHSAPLLLNWFKTYSKHGEELSVAQPFNISYRKVGGLRFVKIGRLTFMWCVSRAYRPLSPAGSRRQSKRGNHAHSQLLLTYSPE
jgi:hypothetical protein